MIGWTTVLLLGATVNISAATNVYYPPTPTYTYQLNGGMGNIKVYLDYASGVGAWEPYITQAAHDWMYTGWGNPIYITFVSSNSASQIDVHADDGSHWEGVGGGVFASTTLRKNGNEVDGDVENWNYADIYLNDPVLRSDDVSNFNCQGTITHEFGHAFGLKHYNTNPTSIMCQIGAGRTVNVPAYCDNCAINNKYNYGG